MNLKVLTKKRTASEVKKYCILISLAVLSTLCFFNCSNQNQPIFTNASTSEAVFETSPAIETPSFSSENKTSTEQTPIETRSQNGILLELNWIYIDRFRIAIEYKITGVEIPQGYQLPCPVLSMSISDSFGNQYDTYKYGYGNTEQLISNCKLNSDKDFIVTHNFYPSNRIEQKEVELDINIAVGGMKISTEDGIQLSIPNYGNFHFTRRVISNENLTLMPNENLILKGLTVTLNRIEINPQSLNSYMCINYNNQKGWYPQVYLLIEGEKIYADPTLIFRTDFKDIDTSDWFDQFSLKRCYRFTFFPENGSFTEISSSKITISLEKLEINILDAATQEDCNNVRNKVQKKYPELDFLCQIDDRDGGYGVLVNITKMPSGMNLADAQKICEQEFISSIYGPWSFSFLMP